MVERFSEKRTPPGMVSGVGKRHIMLQLMLASELPSITRVKHQLDLFHRTEGQVVDGDYSRTLAWETSLTVPYAASPVGGIFLRVPLACR